MMQVLCYNINQTNIYDNVVVLLLNHSQERHAVAGCLENEIPRISQDLSKYLTLQILTIVVCQLHQGFVPFVILMKT